MLTLYFILTNYEFYIILSYIIIFFIKFLGRWIKSMKKNRPHAQVMKIKIFMKHLANYLLQMNYYQEN